MFRTGAGISVCHSRHNAPDHARGGGSPIADNTRQSVTRLPFMRAGAPPLAERVNCASQNFLRALGGVCYALPDLPACPEYPARAGGCHRPRHLGILALPARLTGHAEACRSRPSRGRGPVDAGRGCARPAAGRGVRSRAGWPGAAHGIPVAFSSEALSARGAQPECWTWRGDARQSRAGGGDDGAYPSRPAGMTIIRVRRSAACGPDARRRGPGWIAPAATHRSDAGRAGRAAGPPRCQLSLTTRPRLGTRA